MKNFFAMVVFIVLAGFFGWWVGPGLWTDYALRNQTLEAAQGGQITEARCKTKAFVMTFCDIAYKDPAGEHDFAYLILGMNSDERVSVLRSKTEPGLLTTNIGMSYFIDRLISFVALQIFLIFGVFALLAKLIRGGSAGAQTASTA
jgi:hypothetical protein